MKEKGSVGGRMNISLPADLRKRMKKAEETEAVNWSRVSATAFETKLAEISAKGVTTMKVKIFSQAFTSQPLHNSPADLEKDVNEWLKKAPGVLAILDKKVSSASGVNDDGKAFVNVTVVIFYE